jgi:hypothetical protein
VKPADVVDAMKEAPKGVTIGAIIDEFFDDPVVAALARWAREGAVMCCLSFDDALILCIDRPLSRNPQWGDTGTRDIFDAVGLNGYGPLIFDFLVKGLIEGGFS